MRRGEFRGVRNVERGGMEYKNIKIIKNRKEKRSKMSVVGN